MDFTKTKTSTIFLRYVIPQMVGLIFNSIYFIVDGVFIGRRLGAAAGRGNEKSARNAFAHAVALAVAEAATLLLGWVLWARLWRGIRRPAIALQT